jgi:hypothetical protein
VDPLVASLAGIVELNNSLFAKALDGLDRRAQLARLGDGGSPIIWIAGHLVSARVGMASLLGEPRPAPWGGMFGRGAQVPEDSLLPQAEEILSAWGEASEVLVARLNAATAAQLAAPSPRNFPISDKSVVGGLTFLVYHEGYHLGQLTTLRKAQGLPGLVDA